MNNITNEEIVLDLKLRLDSALDLLERLQATNTSKALNKKIIKLKQQIVKEVLKVLE